MLPYQLEHLFSYSAQLHPPEIIGPVAEGIRANFYVASGEVSGPRVQGILRPVGGDWLTVRSDGVGISMCAPRLKPMTRRSSTSAIPG